MFVPNLNLIGPLENPDERMKEHMVLLDACYREGIFIVSRRKISRTDGIIVAQSSSNEVPEALMRNHPFVANDLATCGLRTYCAHILEISKPSDFLIVFEDSIRSSYSQA